MLSGEHILCNGIYYDDCVIELSDDDDDKKKIPVSAPCTKIDITYSINQPISFCHKYDIKEQEKLFFSNEHNVIKFEHKMGIEMKTLNHLLYNYPIYPTLNKGQVIYAKDINSYSWLKCDVINVVNRHFALVKFNSEDKLMSTKSIAYFEPSPILFSVGTRVIAELNYTNSTTNNNFCAGFIGEPPTLLNKLRYD